MKMLGRHCYLTICNYIIYLSIYIIYITFYIDIHINLYMNYIHTTRYKYLRMIVYPDNAHVKLQELAEKKIFSLA